MGLSFCIPTYNRLTHIKKLIESIRESIGEYPYEIIIGDGGSTDGTIEYLKKQKDVVLIEIRELTGSIKAFNICFKKVKYDYVFWASDDFIIDSKVLIKCCELMDKYTEIGMISPKFVELTKSNFPNVGSWEFLLILSKTHIFRTSVLKQIGYLDEKFRTYWVDADSHLAVLNLGHVTLFTREKGVIHTRVHDETRKSNIQTKKAAEEEFMYYKKKWNFINTHLETSYFKRFKAKLFWSLHDKLRESCIMKNLMKKENPFAINIVDWLLQRSIIFEAKKFRHLKDFYLAQRISNIKKENNLNDNK